MPYRYYNRLNRYQKRIYRDSDRIESVSIPHPAPLRPITVALAQTLVADDRLRTQQLCAELANGIARQLDVAPVRVTVRAARPSANWGELHGLYEASAGAQSARITLWMRTAKRRQVVAFKTFLRTLLHELCHHLDYTYFKLADSYHTEGFYKRESSLFHVLTEPGEPTLEQTRFAEMT